MRKPHSDQKPAHIAGKAKAAKTTSSNEKANDRTKKVVKRKPRLPVFTGKTGGSESQ